ncbi:PLP-dependent transferase [Candidatus Peribacteria bacterium]|nr:PLP-dependent transferase [Candidatus Peribacteria bacterium]
MYSHEKAVAELSSISTLLSACETDDQTRSLLEADISTVNDQINTFVEDESEIIQLRLAIRNILSTFLHLIHRERIKMLTESNLSIHEQDLRVYCGSIVDHYSSLLTTSGMSAYSLAEDHLINQKMQPGDIIICSESVYYRIKQRLERLRKFFNIHFKAIEELEADITSMQPKLVVVDTMGNDSAMRMTNIGALLDVIRENNAKEVSLIIDGTMLPNTTQLSPSDENMYYIESAGKYLQLHTASHNSGVLVSPRNSIPSLQASRRNLGSNPASDFAFHLDESPDAYKKRLTRTSNNAAQAAHYLNNELPPSKLSVVHPDLENHPDHLLAKKLKNMGGNLVLKAPPDISFSKLKAITNKIVSDAQISDIVLSNVSNFGGVEPRILCAGSAQNDFVPFIRLYVGDTSQEYTQRLANCIVDSVNS